MSSISGYPAKGQTLAGKVEEKPISCLRGKARDSTATTAAVHPSPPHKNKRELGLLKATGTGCIEISGAIRKSLTNGQESPRPAPTAN